MARWSAVLGLVLGVLVGSPAGGAPPGGGAPQDEGKLAPRQVLKTMTAYLRPNGPMMQEIAKCRRADQDVTKHTIRVEFVVRGETGKVTEAQLTGDYARRPAWKCIRGQLLKIGFETFKAKEMKFTFPIVLPDLD